MSQIGGHALVVGAPGEHLKGIDYDVWAVSQMLVGRRFSVDVRTGDQATRDGILTGYDELIANVGPDEPAVFYYTGHGFRGAVDAERGKFWQGIAPIDLDASTTTDFRGITAWELSIKQAQLTARTRNVTVILDCCYASQMSRDGAARDAVPRALPHPFRLGFDAHLRALRAKYGAAFDAVDPIGSRDAVRLVACAQDESAYEYPVNGVYRGAFTEALVDVLREVGKAPVSWAALDNAIRTRVHRTFLVQRPGIEGPVRRRPFSLEEADLGDAAPITATRQGFRIGAGHLHGVTRGDVYGVMAPGARAYRAADAIAEVQVSDVSATFADAVPRSERPPVLPEEAVAFPIEKAAIRRAVRIDAASAARPALEHEVIASRVLRVAESDERTVLATLRLGDGALTIEDQLGPLFPATRFPAGLTDTVKNLANLAAAQGLRELEGEHGVSADEIEIEWGAIERGEMRGMPECGGGLALRDKLYVRIQHKGQRELYVHIFNVGLRGRVKLLTDFAPAGVVLNGEEPEFVLGRRSDGALLGLGLSWPRGMPRETFPRVDEIVVIVTSTRTSLRNLETVEQLTARRGAGSPLDDLLAQLQDGRPRSTRGEQSIDGFFVKRLSYLLYPCDAMMADIPFVVDDNPLGNAAARACDAWISPRGDARTPSRRSGMIEVGIEELIVEDKRAIPSDLRLDALICTLSTSETCGHVAWTRRFRGIQDGMRLILDEAVVFRGQVHEFIDICFWISRDAKGSLDLAQLLEQRAASSDLADATRALLIGPDVSAPWIGSVGAGAILRRIAYEQLQRSAGMSVGLYRTSFLAHERFGIGRHPATGVHRAPGVVFSFRIVSPGAESLGNGGNG